MRSRSLAVSVIAVFLLVLVVVVRHCLGQPALSARVLIERADTELLRDEVKRYNETLQAALAASGSPDDHAQAVANLANYEWRIEADFEKARKLLAANENNASALPWLEAARLESFTRNFASARNAALSGLSHATRASEIRNCRVAFSSAVLTGMVTALLDQPSAAVLADSEAAVQQASDLVEPIIHDEPGIRDASRAQLFLSLWLGNGDRAVEAWYSYFRLPTGAAAPEPLTVAAETLRKVLTQFTPESGNAVRRQLVEALRDNRFFDEAAALAIHWNVPRDKVIQQLIDYAQWCRQLSKEFDEIYRQRALGHVDTKRSQQLLKERETELWNKLQEPGGQAFDAQRFMADLRSRFGAEIRPLTTGANYGHEIAERDEAIDQYGHKATLRVVVLDSMVSNAYTTWLWDGRAGVGGWSDPVTNNSPATVIDIRGDRAILAWDSVTDPDLIAKHTEDLARWKTEDDASAKSNLYAYLPGLRLRMILKGRQRILERLKSQGLSGRDLRVAFLDEFERQSDAAIIVAHEGRHALDKIDNPNGYSLEDLEFRAKLSEMAFAPDPLLAVGAIFADNIGVKGDSHGMANERIMKGLVAWMDANAAQIRGLDSARPMLPQFDLLSDEQMRVAFRSMDPWAR